MDRGGSFATRAEKSPPAFPPAKQPSTNPPNPVLMAQGSLDGMRIPFEMRSVSKW